MPERPMLVTADEQLLDELARLAAVAGVELAVHPEPGSARRGWSTAPLVLVGADAAVAAGRAGLPRRRRVVMVGGGAEPPGTALWQQAVAVGAEHVALLPEAQDWLVEALAQAGEDGDGRCVAVVGGRGGAGASTLACALAVTAARSGHRVLLVDGDPLGGGLDVLLGEEETPGLRWPELAGAAGRVSGASLAEALPRVGELSVLSWDRGDRLTVPPAAMAALLDAGLRASELVVVDLPRSLDEASVAALQRAEVVLLVVPAEVRAVAAAGRVAAAVTAHCDDVRVIVRDPSSARLGADAVAAALGLPLAGRLRAEPAVARAMERGEPPPGRRGSLAGLCVALARTLLAAA